MIRWNATRLADLLGQAPPTSEQEAVIEAPLAPQLVIAGAGSGKTATMASRVVHLVANGLASPEQILGLTFTRKAAVELADRVRRRLRGVQQLDPRLDLTEQPRIATYNSYAAGIVQDHALRAGINPDATLISDAGRYQLASEVVLSWDGDLSTSAAPSTLISAVAALSTELAEHGLEAADAVDYLSQLEQSLADKEPEGRQRTPRREVAGLVATLAARTDLLALVAAYQRLKRDRGLVDFGDQVRLAATLASTVGAVGASEREHFRVVLLDEYQDTSIAQVHLLRSLFSGVSAETGRGHPVTAVGDPNQAIYGWRGAAAGTLLDFPAAFPRAEGAPATTVSMSTAWRNAGTILTVANQLARPLRAERADGARHVPVPALRPRPGAPAGSVRARYLETAAAEADTITGFLEGLGWGRPHGLTPAPTAAILCRKRSFFPAITSSLAAAGIPYQVAGLGGLLDVPEVNDLWAALQSAQDPSRGDVLMRLLTGPTVRLGATDLMALSDWSRAQARRAGAADGTRADPEDAEQASLAEAIEHLPRPDWTSPAGRSLSPVARDRVETLATRLRAIRSINHLPPPDLVMAGERILGLDIDVFAHATTANARTHLDRFAAVAADYHHAALPETTGSGAGGIAAFLAWLQVAYELEGGVATTEPEPDPEAVQVMTIHAAKGLEWDAVAVVGLNEKDFPTTAPGKDGSRAASGWLTGVATLPYELRGDAEHLPAFDHERADTHAQMREVWDDFRHEEGERLVREDRRLAYVALTRARDQLLLTGSFWSGRSNVNTPSLFLSEAVRAGADTGDAWPALSVHENDPRSSGALEADWPEADPDAGYWQGLLDRAGGDDPQVDAWWEEARLLLAERDGGADADHSTPGHLSASAVVRLAYDPERFERDRRRPIPHEPSAGAHRGTSFHAWVERYYGASALLDWEGLPGAEDEPGRHGPADLDGLIAAFQRSTWADRRPLQVEADLNTPMGGRTIRCRIDAVFRDDDGADHIVDWKTGSPPSTPEERSAREIQLALYRLAWSRAHGRPLEDVRASFHYVSVNLTVAGSDLDEAAITDVLAQLGG